MCKRLLLSLLLLVCTCFSFSKDKSRQLDIVFIGDSITYGAGLPAREESAPPAVAARYLQKIHAAGVAFSNQGRSGFTTVDYLPATKKAFSPVVEATIALHKNPASTLLFSIMLGTNDSAEEGPNGSPVSPEAYQANLQTITDSLLARFPDSKIVFQCPIWYSTNTYNRSRYLAAGLQRLQQYFPHIKALVKQYASTHPKHVFLGDTKAFGYFEKHAAKLFQAEKGQMGTFYLHPNQKGAAVLGEYWANAIRKLL